MIDRAVWPVLLGLLLVSSSVAPALAQGGGTPQQPAPRLQVLLITGTTVYSQQEIASRLRIAVGQPLEEAPEDVAKAVSEQYHEDGYTMATAAAAFDAASGTLTVTVDEGRFDAIDVTGLDATTRQLLLERLALQPGELFNVTQAETALQDALSVAKGAIERAAPTFRFVPDAGRRVLQITLRTRNQEVAAFFGTQGREDWFSPVDGFNPAIGVRGTIFDRTRFNHTYWSAYVSYKFGPDRPGYAFGLERSLLRDDLVTVGASIQDLTATDDGWRLSNAEQSLVAVVFRNTFRDYYRRKGYQVQTTVKPLEGHEFLVAWRDEKHSALMNETDFAVFRDDHEFRSNAAADPGTLHAVILGYTFDSRGFAPDPIADRRRHLIDDLFGNDTGREHGVRVDWRSELAPASLDHDFDFTRHIVNVRGWWQSSPGRLLSARLLAGSSTGVLPPQRVFALGGIGSVHGYGFKEQAGDGMLLMNAEYRHELWKSELSGLVFVDAGRVYGQTTAVPEKWMRGVGVGLELDGGARIEFGWRLDDIPSSLQVLFRLRPTF